MGKKRNITEKVDYQSNRPFLLINMVHRPASHVRTNVKGWMNVENNLTTEENPIMVDRITDRHARTASVIIDVINGTLIKNRFSDTPNADVYKHFANKYQEQIAHSMQIWRARTAQSTNVVDTTSQNQYQPITVTMV